MDKREQYLQVQVSSVVGISGKLRHSFGPLHFDGNTTWAVFFSRKIPETTLILEIETLKNSENDYFAHFHC